MVGPLLHSGDWKVDVRFRDKGNLQATASGVLLVPPEDALAFVTDAGERLRLNLIGSLSTATYSRHLSGPLFMQGKVRLGGDRVSPHEVDQSLVVAFGVIP